MNILVALLVILYGLGLAFIFCYSLVQVHLTYLYYRAKSKLRGPIKYTPPEHWPAVTVQLPIYNERYVVERLIDAVAALNYSAGQLQIQILDDSDDETQTLIAAKVAFYQTQGLNMSQVRRPDRTGYKAGALQYGLQQATGEYIAIFDADFLPNPDYLRQTLPVFSHPRVGVVQTRWGHLNQEYSLLTKLQAFALDAHFTVEQSGRNFGRYFINFNGTAGVWRKNCILDAGGWQADTLTEDLDLSYRAQLRHWEFCYLEEIVAPAELPATMPAVKSQQFRWTKGAAETARKNLGNVFRSDLSFPTKLHAFFHLGNSSVFICVLVTALLSLPMLFIRAHWQPLQAYLPTKALFVISLTGLLLFYWTGFRSSSPNQPPSVFTFLSRFFWFLALSMGLSLHNAIAVTEGYLGKKTPFIRTPKFNLRSRRDTWQQHAYRTRAVSFLTVLEGVLALYFLAGIGFSFYFQDYGLMPFHFLLTLGFGGVFYYSLRHSQ